MRKKTFSLLTGVQIGEIYVKDIEIREGTVEDTLNAAEEPDQRTGLAYGVAIMRRRITRLGELNGPISKEIMKKLTDTDYKIIDREIFDLDKEIEKEAVELLGGRSLDVEE